MHTRQQISLVMPRGMGKLLKPRVVTSASRRSGGGGDDDDEDIGSGMVKGYLNTDEASCTSNRTSCTPGHVIHAAVCFTRTHKIRRLVVLDCTKAKPLLEPLVPTAQIAIILAPAHSCLACCAPLPFLVCHGCHPQLLNFDIGIALGPHLLSVEEFESLLSQGKRIVFYKGSYLEVRFCEPFKARYRGPCKYYWLGCVQCDLAACAEMI
jgi:hypothetical protein